MDNDGLQFMEMATFARSVKPIAKKPLRLLQGLTQRYPRTPGNMAAVFKYIASLVDELREEGVFNMLLSEGAL
ncbi:hypothetical protein ACNKHN_01530 [Shigella flexneri]